MANITVVDEDDLSAAVARRLVRLRNDLTVDQHLQRHGFGYIKRIARGLNRAAAGYPYFIMTDLDDNDCPASLIDEWLEGDVIHPNLLFRVAVREVESWLLADPWLISRLLGLAEAHAPSRPDELDDPKAFLVNLAARSKRSVRHDLVPKPRSGAVQGPNYNAVLVKFVEEEWDPHRAKAQSPSLARCIERLLDWQPQN